MRVTCLLDPQHDPHDRGAIFCWVCGTELFCEDCERPASDHLFYDFGCPVVRLQPRPIAAITSSPS